MRPETPTRDHFKKMRPHCVGCRVGGRGLQVGPSRKKTYLLHSIPETPLAHWTGAKFSIVEPALHETIFGRTYLRGVFRVLARPQTSCFENVAFGHPEALSHRVRGRLQKMKHGTECQAKDEQTLRHLGALASSLTSFELFFQTWANRFEHCRAMAFRLWTSTVYHSLPMFVSFCVARSLAGRTCQELVLQDFHQSCSKCKQSLSCS